jgi:hypothetical protein
MRIELQKVMIMTLWKVRLDGCGLIGINGVYVVWACFLENVLHIPILSDGVLHVSILPKCYHV